MFHFIVLNIINSRRTRTLMIFSTLTHCIVILNYTCFLLNIWVCPAISDKKKRFFFKSAQTHGIKGHTEPGYLTIGTSGNHQQLWKRVTFLRAALSIPRIWRFLQRFPSFPQLSGSSFCGRDPCTGSSLGRWALYALSHNFWGQQVCPEAFTKREKDTMEKKALCQMQKLYWLFSFFFTFSFSGCLLSVRL